MVLSIKSELAALLDDLTVGPVDGFSLTFQVLPKGRHQDLDQQDAAKGLIWLSEVIMDSKTTDIGGQVDDDTQFVDVNAEWEDDDGILDPEKFRKEVVKAINTVVRSNQRSIGDSYYTHLVNSIELDGELSDVGGLILYRQVLTYRAKNVESY